MKDHNKQHRIKIKKLKLKQIKRSTTKKINFQITMHKVLHFKFLWFLFLLVHVCLELLLVCAVGFAWDVFGLVVSTYPAGMTDNKSGFNQSIKCTSRHTWVRDNSLPKLITILTLLPASGLR
jgi:hypothetical protein